MEPVEKRIHVATALEQGRIGPKELEGRTPEEMAELIEALRTIQKNPQELSLLLPTMPPGYKVVGVILKIRERVDKFFDFLLEMNMPRNHVGVTKCLIAMVNTILVTKKSPSSAPIRGNSLSTASLLMSDIPIGLDVLDDIARQHPEVDSMVNSVRFSDKVKLGDSTEIFPDSPLCHENWGIIFLSDKRIHDTETLKYLLTTHAKEWDARQQQTKRDLESMMQPHPQRELRIDATWDKFHTQGITVQDVQELITKLQQHWRGKSLLLLQNIEKVIITISDQFSKETNDDQKTVHLQIDASADIEKILHFLAGEF